jgi:hypothetical protein
MKQHTLVMGSIIAVAIIAVAICVGMVSGYPVFKPFISVDPVGDKNIGEHILITGKTSLPAGSEILIEVSPASFEPGPGMVADPKTGVVSGEFTGAMGTVTVVKDMAGSNVWSLPIETKTFKPMIYLVSASNLKGDLSKGNLMRGEISGETQFTLHASPLINSKALFITVDQISDKKIGDKFTVAGSTTLPVGTEILVDVSPVSFIPDPKTTPDPKTGAVSGEFTGVKATMTVTGGNEGKNLWSFNLDTSTFKSTEYSVTVIPMKNDLAGGAISAATSFNVN